MSFKLLHLVFQLSTVADGSYTCICALQQKKRVSKYSTRDNHVSDINDMRCIWHITNETATSLATSIINLLGVYISGVIKHSSRVIALCHR